jgi:5'-nucleotidase (lipoprotein e(P4) family)
MKKFFLLVLLSVGIMVYFQYCSNSNAFNSSPDSEPSVNSNDHLMMAVLYQQTAAEYRALCYQAFNFAKYKLDQSSKAMGMMKQRAIIVDIDETVLDNSPYEATCILDAINYPASWDEWVIKASAKPVPGALEFLQNAAAQGVNIFYISNRKEKLREATLSNLVSIGFPDADNEHLLLQTDDSSKKARREKIAGNHWIVLLIGDNLNDFSEVFEKKLIPERFEMTDSLKNEFGNRFIVLPNAIYGDWEGAIYNYNYPTNSDEKIELLHKALTGF